MAESDTPPLADEGEHGVELEWWDASGDSVTTCLCGEVLTDVEWHEHFKALGLDPHLGWDPAVYGCETCLPEDGADG